MHLFKSYTRVHPGNRAMLQKELIIQNTKLLLKLTNLKLKISKLKSQIVRKLQPAKLRLGLG